MATPSSCDRDPRVTSGPHAASTAVSPISLYGLMTVAPGPYSTRTYPRPRTLRELSLVALAGRVYFIIMRWCTALHSTPAELTSTAAGLAA
eukprot:scaffold116453_cov63-Phaeocystis_antarctica.AAC.1